MHPSNARRVSSLRTFTLVISSALVLAACATSRAPSGEMAVAQTTVDRVAAAPGTASAAPVELQSARDKLARAQRAMDNRQYTLARQLAEQAEVDARLAEARTQAVRSETALREVDESIRRAAPQPANQVAPVRRQAPVYAPAPSLRMTPAAPLR